MLKYNIIERKYISKETSEKMFFMMKKYYENVSKVKFYSDLEEKEQVIILTCNNELRGFSTQRFFEYSNNTLIAFSGDTIIEKEHRNSTALPIAWIKLMLSVLETNPNKELYWILTSKGYKTYRFLPVFFNDYYPSRERKITNIEKEIIVKFCEKEFPSVFDKKNLLLRADEKSQRLCKGVADVTERRRKNKDIVFFEKKNPDHSKGDELICLARF